MGPEVTLLDLQGQGSLMLANNGDLQYRYEWYDLLHTNQAYRRLVKADSKQKILNHVEALLGLLILDKVMELH